MAIGPHSFLLFLAQVMPLTLGTAEIGGVASGSQLSATSAAPVFASMASDGPGGSTRYQYAKIFDANQSASEDASGYGILLAGALDDIPTPGFYSVAGSEEDDGKRVRIRSLNSLGHPVDYTAELESGVAGFVTPMFGLARVTVQDATGVESPLAQDLVISHEGLEVGRIPAGGWCATNEIDIGLEAEIDGDQSTANPTTAPPGVSWSRPRSPEERLLVNAETGDFPARSAQGVWLRWKLPSRILEADLACYVVGCCPEVGLTRLRGFRFSQDPAANAPGGISGWEKAWKQGFGDLSVRIVSSEGHGDAIACAAHTITIGQSESTTQQIQIDMVDRSYKLHPYGEGPHKAALVKDADVQIDVTYGGKTKPFFGLSKRARISRDSSNVPQYSWPLVDHPDKLFRNKKSLETIGGNYLAPAPTNHVALAEACAAAGVAGDWTGITSLRLGGPYHRQQKTPGELVQEVLDLTLDEWRTEGKKIVGYDPERGGRVWEYDVDLDSCVRSHGVTPQDNDEIEKVKVLRPIATGSLVTSGGVEVKVECDEFGAGRGATFDPPITGLSWEYIYRDPRARLSYLDMYNQGVLKASRVVINPLDRPDSMKLAHPFEIDEVRFVWGASGPDVPMDLPGAKGAVRFRGRPTSRATIGSEESERPPIDETTILYVGDGPDEDAFELSPNPLLFDRAAMQLHGERFLRRVGRQQAEHPLVLPLNHLITLGDIIRLKRDRNLGGSGWITLVVIAYQHVISHDIASRQTTVAGVEYLD